MRFSKRQLVNLIEGLLKEEVEGEFLPGSEEWNTEQSEIDISHTLPAGVSAMDSIHKGNRVKTLAPDDSASTNRQFLSELYNAVVDQTGSTGFGFLFEQIVVNNSDLLGLSNPQVLNLTEGGTNTAFADIIADDDIYYSVKCSIWEGGSPSNRLITEVNSSKSTSIIQLARGVGKDKLDAGEPFDMKCGIITGHPSGKLTRKAKFQSLGMVVEILGPEFNNIRVRQDEAGSLIVVQLDSNGEEVTDNISAKPTSVSAFKKAFFHSTVPETSNSGNKELSVSPLRSEVSDINLETGMLEKIKEIVDSSGLAARLRSISGKASKYHDDGSLKTKEEINLAKAKDAAQQKGTAKARQGLSGSTLFGDVQGKKTKEADIVRDIANNKRSWRKVAKRMFRRGTSFLPGQAEQISDLGFALVDLASIGKYSKQRAIQILSNLLRAVDPDVAKAAIEDALSKDDGRLSNLLRAVDPDLKESNVIEFGDPQRIIGMIAAKVQQLIDSATEEDGPAIADYIIDKMEEARDELLLLPEEEEADVSDVDLDGDGELNSAEVINLANQLEDQPGKLKVAESRLYERILKALIKQTNN